MPPVEPTQIHQLTLFVALGAMLALLIAAVVLWLVQATRRRRLEKQRRLAELGFVPVPYPDPDLVESLARLSRQNLEDVVELDNLLCRSESQADVYLFDRLQRRSGESSHSQGVLGLVSAELDVPYMVLFPVPEQPFKKGGLLYDGATRLLDWALARSGLVRVTFPERPDFEAGFFVLGLNEGDVRRFLTGDRMDELMALAAPFQVAGWGRAFILEDNPTHSGAQPAQSLDQRLETLHRLEKIWREKNPTGGPSLE